MNLLATTYKPKCIYSLLILVIFTLIGAVGITIDSEFSSLTSFNLLVTFFILIVNFKEFNKSILICYSIIYLISFSVEFIGVHYKLLFGSYDYGNSLGYKIGEVPLLIGVNWVIVAVGSFEVSKYITTNKFLLPILAAALMTFLDLFIEPICDEMGMWYWDNEVTWYNFFCWFGIGYIVQLIYINMKLPSNKIGAYIYLSQLLLFIYLNLIWMLF